MKSAPLRSNPRAKWLPCLTISDHWRRYDLMLIVYGFSWCARWPPPFFATSARIRFSGFDCRDMSEPLTHRAQKKIIATMTCCIAIYAISHVAATNESLANG
jgi:hypothetical protein